MKPKNPKSARSSSGLNMEGWRKLYVSGVETAAEDVPDTEPSGNLARIFVVLLLVHVFLIGAIVLYNFMSDRPPRTSLVDNGLTNSNVKGSQQGAHATNAKSGKTDGALHYTVASGDTPASIAQKFGIEASALVRENHLEQVSLYPEMDLVIPGKQTPKVAQSAPVSKPADKPTPVAVIPPAATVPAAMEVKQDPPKGPAALAQNDKNKADSAVPQARLVAPPPAVEENPPQEATADTATATSGSTHAATPSKDKPSHTADSHTKDRDRDQDTPPATTKPAKSDKLAASGKTHTVTGKDTLYSISRKYKVKVDDLMKLNNITDPSKLRDGLKLKIPQKNS